MKIQTAFKIAASFFGIGTFIFVGHILSPETMFWFAIGFLFIIIATIVNGLAVIGCIVKLIKYDRLETFYAICILLCNIPIAVTYIHFV